MSDQNNDLLNEVRDLIYNLDKKLDLNTQKTEITLEQVTKINDDQNQVLKGFNERIKQIEQEVNQVKKPFEWLGMTMKVLGGISLILGLIYAIMKLKG